MSRKQIITRVVIILVISLIVAVAFFFCLKTYQGHKNIAMIDSYLEEKNLKDKVKTQDTLYSAKKGIYYKEITFKDDPGVTYIVQPISTYKGIFVEGFDSETKKSLKHAKHKYFSQTYKPNK
ncbi:DUF3139 domain-containing protein [Staphylococcus simiae]|uniref:DUF3139 domain-containing protein n=1 Tax=Staphylococcus simiae TaxID=308354 RepID=UPI001A96A2BF|nr:DUF3139 domain-containing protein [Staphylococcus simiae]MBO1199877.1 DUF3139 domain-containing protein [Staphylococcus simiae]MBO1202139.1 DUF3139 domain-containing protein [Staphylococcus simiae]MBO1204396.1 DUF3139 domain-containing protein [Staphylococcus simiae]MBO1211937.1 DUF3139 domain-containing protein [Staphylococcus simiae]MBO1230582.1 DUF3139 domain-containing protein [Staphylococcus simiae]